MCAVKSDFALHLNQMASTATIAIGGKAVSYLLHKDGEPQREHEFNAGSVRILERLATTSLYAVVRCNAPHVLELYDAIAERAEASIELCGSISSVKLSAHYLAVCVESNIYVRSTVGDLRTELLDAPLQTSANANGVMALSTDGDQNSLLAYPLDSKQVTLRLFDVHDKAVIATIDIGGNAPLSAVEFDARAERIAVAITGNMDIRIFNIANGTLVCTLRPTLQIPQRITCLTFSDCGDYLACAVAGQRVCVFKLSTDASYFGSISNAFNYYFGSTAAPRTEFASVTMHNSGVELKCAIKTFTKKCGKHTTENVQRRLIIAASDGCLQIYAIPNAAKQICTLEHSLSLHADDSEAFVLLNEDDDDDDEDDEGIVKVSSVENSTALQEPAITVVEDVWEIDGRDAVQMDDIPVEEEDEQDEYLCDGACQCGKNRCSCDYLEQKSYKSRQIKHRIKYYSKTYYSCFAYRNLHY